MNPSKRTVSVDLRIIIGVLLAVIIAMLLLWRPWGNAGITDRTVKVEGQATITAVPDEFVFYPSYQFKNADREAALKDLTAKSDAITKKLKELGIPESKIKTNANGFDALFSKPSDDSTTYMLQMTITAANQELAQKVQDYLASTSPVGAVSPQAGFSDAKRKDLEAKAQEQATKDARAKAERMGKDFGFTLGKVKTIDDGASLDTVQPYSARGSEMSATDKPTSATKLQVQPGENELPYSVTVTYFIR